MNLSNRLRALTQKNRPEWLVWGFFCVLLGTVLCFHEPWFDEVQAWLIAKDAPWKDLLFVLPHYEGHPPFFHLLLRLPALLGVSGLWALRGLGLLCGACSAYLIIFKSPFPRWVRFCLPFSFFLFYQYGVIVRPYNIMVLVMCLLAVYFPQKDKRPGLFVGLLAALCACHLFGIAIAGGIAVAWLWEIKAGQPWAVYMRGLVEDRRFYWLLGLLIWAVLLMGWIVPRPDTFAGAPTFRQGSLIRQLIYLLFILPADTMLTSVYDARMPLTALSFSSLTLICGCFVGIFLWIALWQGITRRFLPYLLFPYFFVVLPMSYYMSRHHEGIVFLIFLFAYWICWQQKPVRLRSWAKVVIALALLNCVGWTMLNSYYEIKYSGFTGRQFVQFLRAHHLEDTRIFARWTYLTPEELKALPYYVRPEDREDTLHIPIATEISFYLPRNIFANFNDAKPIAYVTHIHPSVQEQQRILASWRAGGLPDVMVGEFILDHVFEQENTRAQYALVSQLEYYEIWKFNKPKHNYIPVYVGKELAAAHHLAAESEIDFFKRTIDK